MYTEADYIDIARRIRKNWLVWIPVTVAFILLMALALICRVEWLAYAAAIGLVVTACFGFAFCQLPCLRYQSFLMDLREGLTREMAGRVVSVADVPELQDGARVLHVHLRLKDEDDERIVYLNASKRDRFPPVGTDVRLKLCGRHIREVVVG